MTPDIICLSTLIHAILLLSLGLVPWEAYSRSNNGEDAADKATAFAPAETDRGEAPEIARFERGKAQIEPSVLNDKTLAMFQDLPVGDPSGDRDLKPEDVGNSGRRNVGWDEKSHLSRHRKYPRRRCKRPWLAL